MGTVRQQRGLIKPTINLMKPEIFKLRGGSSSIGLGHVVPRHSFSCGILVSSSEKTLLNCPFEDYESEKHIYLMPYANEYSKSFTELRLN
jgi:hypothetical protein